MKASKQALAITKWKHKMMARFGAKNISFGEIKKDEEGNWAMDFKVRDGAENYQD